MGSIFGDNEKNSINKRCRPRAKMGKLSEMTTGSGRIEMIRKNRSGEIESFNVEGGMVIDDNGTWAYQIPMNLDYVITDEFGNLVPTDDVNKGLPTRTRVRFRVGIFTTGSEGRVRTRAKYLIPNNPNSFSDSDYSFDETTKDISFTDLYWNKIYSVSNHITRINRRCPSLNPKLCATTKNYIGLKDVDDEGGKTPHPFNRISTTPNPLFNIICIIIGILSFIVGAINGVIKLINNIMKNNGGETDYYKVPEGANTLQDLIEYKNMNFALGNIFKACYRLGEKVDKEYDLNKIIYFAERIKNELKQHQP
jgi:hypothetical protein